MTYRMQIAGLILITVSLFSTGCATVRSHRTLLQPSGVTLTAGIGSTLFHLNKTGDLPNAFGGRDIWGGKVDKGYAEMKLLAIDGSVLTLEIVDIDKQSAETVMDRYKPFQNPNAVNVENKINIGTQSPEAVSSMIKFDTAKQKEIVVGGIKVSFLDVQPYSVQYMLFDVMPSIR